MVYFGTAKAALTMFEEAGLPCPPLRNPTDHFLHVINKDFKVGLGVRVDGLLSLDAARGIGWSPRTRRPQHSLNLLLLRSAYMTVHACVISVPFPFCLPTVPGHYHRAYN